MSLIKSYPRSAVQFAAARLLADLHATYPPSGAAGSPIDSVAGDDPITSLNPDHLLESVPTPQPDCQFTGR